MDNGTTIAEVISEASARLHTHTLQTAPKVELVHHETCHIGGMWGVNLVDPCPRCQQPHSWGESGFRGVPWTDVLEAGSILTITCAKGYVAMVHYDGARYPTGRPDLQGDTFAVVVAKVSEDVPAQNPWS